MTTDKTSPGEIYAQRLAAAERDRQDLAARNRRMGNARVAVFFGMLAILALATLRHLFSPPWTLIPAAIFLAQIVLHDRLAERLQTATRKVEFYAGGVRRITDTWSGHGDTGHRYIDAAHPYAQDLDIFGDRSLYQLLCMSKTRAGDDCLARWLSAPAEADVAIARQAAVRELIPRLDLREQIALDGELASGSVSPEGLSAWGEAAPIAISAGQRVFAGLLAACNLATLTYLAVTHRGIPFGISLAVTFVFSARHAKWIKATMKTTASANSSLTNLAALLHRIENEPVDTPFLRSIQQRLSDDTGSRSSKAIERFQKLTAWLDAANNQLVALIATLLLWQFQCCASIEGWRARNGPHLREWLGACGEFEAIGALANFGYENPGACFPEIASGPPRLAAAGLAHPLLARSVRVANDIAIGAPDAVLIVSGSNMSGKSTLMRTVGVNTVLALAGGPAIARSMSVTPLQAAASIRTLDSLQEGISRFYAEIKRIHQVVSLTSQPLPVLFLLDEILHGTNSHDRQIGAEAIVRSLRAAGAIGLVTTHDLALARLAEDTSVEARNVHFEDQIVEGRMVFDYRLKDGVVQKSNAIALMRAVGLDV